MDDEAGKARASDPLLGRVVQGRYRFVRLLGEGGMGRVYEGEHVEIGRRVAIKCLLPELAAEPSVLERFRREALAATQAGNEHIVEVTDWGTLDNGGPYMVLEYLDGRDLDDAIEQDGPLPFDRAASIVCQVCDALNAAHEKGIVHRDLKPSNVYLVARGENPDFVKVLDFGISKFRALGGDEGKLTKTGAVLGTPFFMSPEQVNSRPDVDHRADIFALGGMLYYALTGRLPFRGDSLHGLLYAVCTAEPTPLQELRPDVPDAIAAAVHKALRKEPEYRYGSCAELKAALIPYRAISTMPPPISSFAPPRPSALSTSGYGARLSRVGWPRVALAGTLALGMALALLMWRTRPAAEPAAGRTGGTAPADAVTDTPETTPAATTVAVSLRTAPAGAELRVDGRPVPNPYRAELPLENRELAVEASLAGYTTARRSLRLTGSHDLVLELDEAAPERTRPEPRRTATLAATRKREKGQGAASGAPDDGDEPASQEPAGKEPARHGAEPARPAEATPSRKPARTPSPRSAAPLVPELKLKRVRPSQGHAE